MEAFCKPFSPAIRIVLKAAGGWLAGFSCTGEANKALGFGPSSNPVGREMLPS